MILVSILVPVYGAQQYIVECARSLFSQSYSNCEFIFVDDASPDQSLELLKQTANEFPHLEKRINIIECLKNGGVATARNIAINAATGDYILFVDADDWVDKDIVEKLVKKTIETDADVCNAWCESVTANDTRLQESTNWLPNREAHIKAILGQSHLVPNHVRGMLLRRSIFEQNNLQFTPKVDFGEDYSLLPQIIYFARKLSTLQEYLYYYRVCNDSSYMNTIGERHIRNYIAAEKIVNDFFKSQPEFKTYRRSLLLGKVNIRKWIFKRGAAPKEYFNIEESLTGYPLLWLYNKVIDSGIKPLVYIFSVLVNFGLYIKVSLQRKLL
ncbi:MAG: glycosyltransferase family 2 protein [Rikenellaceae bacterium]